MEIPGQNLISQEDLYKLSPLSFFHRPEEIEVFVKKNEITSEQILTKVDSPKVLTVTEI
jgi:hypothetical protein